MPQTIHAPLRLPEKFRKRLGAHHEKRSVKKTLRQGELHTVCEEAKCPNLRECFSSGTATFMILGDTCTRRCHFCAVKTGRPLTVDSREPARLADAVTAMGLRHVVITSVDRDDLRDKGAGHFAACINAVKKLPSRPTVEILTPDFQGQHHLIDIVLEAEPDVFNHNIETVERLYKKVRPQSNWSVTSEVLRYVAAQKSSTVKSGMMVGLGETDGEVEETFEHLAALGVEVVTVGQYLRPKLSLWPVARYVEDATYRSYESKGRALGFSHIFAGPFVRSSYRAGEVHIASASGTGTSLPIASDGKSV